MRKRNYNINVRVALGEKKRLMRAAKRFGLSLSEYLRKVGLNEKLSEKPSKEFYEVYCAVNDLLNDFQSLDRNYIEVNLKEIERKILSAYHEKEDDDSVGDNKNLGN